MPAYRVEYRIHSATADVLGEERYPLALLHWDGRELRLAIRQGIPSALAVEERALARSLKSLRRRAEKLGPHPLIGGLAEVIDVRTGDAGGTQWSPVRIGTTLDPQAHFEELRRSLRLVDTRRAAAAVSREDVADALSSLGETLVPKLGARVTTRKELEGFEPHTSPLSWMNHAWVHTLPMVVGLAARGHDAVRRVASTLDLSIPQGDRLVVAYVRPERPEIAEEFHRGLEFLRVNVAGDRLRSVGLDALGEDLDLAPIRAVVERDVGE